jgi:hypothetical protein
MDLRLEVLEPMRALAKWLVPDNDLRRLFGRELEPYHASLIADLAGRFDPDHGPELPMVNIDLTRSYDAQADYQKLASLAMG